MPDPYPNLRAVLAPEFAALPAPQLAARLGAYGTSAEDLEDFFGSISDFGKAIGQRLPQIAQGAISGATTGAALGPWGALAGALGGAAIGGLTATPGRPSPPAQPVPGRSPVLGGSPAAAQLLGALTSPQMLQALMSMAMGRGGAPTVGAGGSQVPVAAIANMLGALGGQAAREYDELLHIEDGEGEAGYSAGAADPADPLMRAEALAGILTAANSAPARPVFFHSPVEVDEVVPLAEYEPVYA